MKGPPRAAEALLGLLLPSHDRDEILGDLSESYRRRTERAPGAAWLWYWSQVVILPFWIRGSAVRPGFDGTEIRQVLRGLLTSPAFTAVAVVSLGLGIGASAAIGGALNALLLRTLPVDDPHEIGLVYHSWPDTWEGGQYGSASTVDPTDGLSLASNVSYPAWQKLEESTTQPTRLAAFAFIRELAVQREVGPPEAVGGMLVSGEYFTTVGVNAALGRTIGFGDTEAGAEPVAMVSHALWQDAFGGDPDVIGQFVRLNGEAYRIVGVTPREYVGLSPGGFWAPVDVTVPLSSASSFLNFSTADGAPLETSGLTHWLRIIARMPEEVDAQAAERAWSETLRANMVEAGVVAAGDAEAVTVRALDGSRGLDSLRAGTERPLLILTVVVGLVLLIACANLSTLLLARATSRSEELALRRAIGASRWELARPQLLEGALLGAAGAGVGLWVALEGGPLLVSSLTGGAGFAAVHYDVDATLLAVTCGIAVFAALTSSVLPAVRRMQAEPRAEMGTRGGTPGKLGTWRALLAIQIAISVPLVVGAGLFLRTLGNVAAIDPGFDPEGVVAFRVDASFVTDDPGEEEAIYTEILAGLRENASFREAAVVENVLVSGYQSNGRVHIPSTDERPMMDMNAVSDAFFETMGMTLLSGRSFTGDDVANRAAVAVINETAGEQLFGGQALGQTLNASGDRPLRVVGVVADTKYSSLKEDVDPVFFEPWTQRPGGLWRVHFVAKAADPTADLEAVARAVVADVHPGLPIAAYRAQNDELAAQMARERVFARLLSGFGVFALLLSCIGLYGLMSFFVAQRRAEMGIRLALGAAPLSIVRLVLAQVARLTTVGLAVGLVLAYQVGPAVRSLLFGVEPDDGWTLALTAVAMAMVSLVAGAMPALRASRVDPLESFHG